MEPKIILSGKPNKFFKWIYAILGLSFILQSITIYEEGSIPFYLTLFGGIVLILGSIFYSIPKFLKYIKISDDGIIFKPNILGKEKFLSWEKIKRVDFNVHRMEITCYNNEIYRISFFELDYKTRHYILRDFLKSIAEKRKGIPDFSIKI